MLGQQVMYQQKSLRDIFKNKASIPPLNELGGLLEAIYMKNLYEDFDTWEDGSLTWYLVMRESRQGLPRQRLRRWAVLAKDALHANKKAGINYRGSRTR